MDMEDKKIIYLEREDTVGEGSIKYPLYENCYASALETVWNIIQHNKYNESWDKNTPQGASNIIAFMGVRGSGKTTALNEFNMILNNYDNYKMTNQRELFPQKGISEQKGWFHVLKNIDASLLEKDEDIIELIWANMYKDFDKTNRTGVGYRECQGHRENREEEGKKIIAQFDNVYSNYKLSREGQVMLGDTALAKLRNLSSSLKTKESCDRLIKEYLEYMQPKKDREKEAFLVVTVDDLDLNLESGYRTLENLYRYLNNPQVIVLIAVDYIQTKTMCDKHFIDALCTQQSRDKFRNVDHAERLSSDFLVKVIPLANRIYLPNYKNVLSKATIVDKSRKSDLKHFVLGKIAEKMDIYYDAVGLKWHFCLPKTIRELVQYNDFLNTLYDIESKRNESEEQGLENLRLYDINQERFNRDICDNMAFRVLNLEQQKIFELILARNIERRAEYAVNFLSDRKETVAQERERLKLSDTVDDQNYSYCDLLQAIHDLGRANYNDKALIHCILASFTSEMNREYHHYIYEKDEKEQNAAAKCLESFLGNTFGGNWFKDMKLEMVPVENSISNNKTVKLCCVDQGDANQFCYSYQIKSKNSQEMIQIEDVVDMVPVLECVFALFPNYYDKDGHKSEPMWQMTFHNGARDSHGQVDVELLNVKVDFDILGFIGREVEFEGKSKLQSQSDKIIDSLIQGYTEYYNREKYNAAKNNRGNAKKADREKWKKQLQSQSIWSGSQERKVYFPFYSVDMAYNVIKRVRRKMKRVEKIQINEILQYLRKVYGYIAYELRREDDFYREVKETIASSSQEDCDEWLLTHFEEDFVSNPVIKAIGCQYEGQEKKQTEPKEKETAVTKENMFNEMLFAILYSFKRNWADVYAKAEIEE